MIPTERNSLDGVVPEGATGTNPIITSLDDLPEAAKALIVEATKDNASGKMPCCTCNAIGTLEPVGFTHRPSLVMICHNCHKEMEFWKALRQSFTWMYDGGAREVTWDIVSIWEWLTQGDELNPFEVGTKMYFAFMAKSHAISYCKLPIEFIDYCIMLNGDFAVDQTDYAMERSSDWPVIVIEHPSVYSQMDDTGVAPLLPIDGWNRMYKAHKERKDLMMLAFMRRDEMAFRVRDIVFAGYPGFEQKGGMAYHFSPDSPLYNDPKAVAKREANKK